MLILYGILGTFMLLAWPLLVVLHELGHAVPALLFTRGPVQVYLGSYGDGHNCWRGRVGRLDFYAKRHLLWAGGCCRFAAPDLPAGQQAVILLGGVVVSLAVAVLGFGGAVMLDLHGSVKLLLFLLTLMAAYSLVTNLVPGRRGGVANDGLLLKWLLTGQEPTPNFGLDLTFSAELKELIAYSRTVALDLGYDHISTLHVLLADCALPYPYALTALLFPDPAGLAAFYEHCRLGPANPAAAAGSLPLTTELEQALQLAYTTRRHGLSDTLYPAHLLVAASEAPDSVLRQVVPTPDLPQHLLAYYRPFGELWA